MRFAMSILSILVPFASGWAQGGGACPAATLRGTYGVTCSGYLSPGPGAPQAPVSLIGTVTGDASGNFSGTAKISLGGVIADQSVSGPWVSNGDCTGTISYDQKINGQPAGKINIVAHVLDAGKEIRGMSVDPGTTMTCNLRLIER